MMWPRIGRVTAAINSTMAWCGTRTDSSMMPRLRISVATFCFPAKRVSNRYTRMFVSTRAATSVEVLSRLAPVVGPPFHRLKRALAETLGCLVEQMEPELSILGSRLAARGNDPNHVAGGHPVNVITWTDAVLVCD